MGQVRDIRRCTLHTHHPLKTNGEHQNTPHSPQGDWQIKISAKAALKTAPQNRGAFVLLKGCISKFLNQPTQGHQEARPGHEQSPS